MSAAGQGNRSLNVPVAWKLLLNDLARSKKRKHPHQGIESEPSDFFIISLAKNIARRGYRPLEILADIEILRKRGYSAEIIIQKTGLSPKYVKAIIFYSMRAKSSSMST